MNITKELLINLIKEELNQIVEKKVVRELDIIPGQTLKSNMIGDNHKIVLAKFKNSETNKISFYVAVIEGTGKDEALTQMRKSFKEEQHARNFFNKYKDEDLKRLKHIFKQKKKEGKDESQSST